MNQQGCLFIRNRKALVDLIESNTEQLMKFSNKYRSFVFIFEDHYENESEFEKQVHLNTILPLNELLTQFLTHTPQGQVITEPFIIDQPTAYWIHDIDAFISLPAGIEAKLANTGPHTYFYENLNFLDRTK